ncbi:hypothetical protein K501DRAFT_269454 [Backusella circina FSU 941]|nr:hypothetical protein K501DRAFT_269454 [Backusella circina FSU 941]
MNFIKKIQRRLPEAILFSELKEKSESFDIAEIDLKKAQNGNIDCLFAIVNKCYRHHWYEGVLVIANRLSKRNHGESQRMIGELFERGHFGFKNEQLAKQWYRRAAENGSIIALEYLKQRFAGKKKAARIRKLELKCYTQAAVLWNSKEAQFMLGTFFDNGIGVDIDKEFAKIWYSKSALQGHELAIEKAKELEKEGYAFILISPVADSTADNVADTTIIEEQDASICGEDRSASRVNTEESQINDDKSKQISMQQYHTLLEKLGQIESNMALLNLSRHASGFSSGSEVFYDATEDIQK